MVQRTRKIYNGINAICVEGEKTRPRLKKMKQLKAD
jgi:hypothetical protein